MARGSLVVGVDAGGSSVDAVALDDSTVVGRGAGGPANLRVIGINNAADEIARAVCAAAGSRKPIAALYVGAAGAGSAASAAALGEALHQRLPDVAEIVVADDTRIALRAAIPEGPGIVIVAGTGSIAYGENGAERFRVGGGGYLVGDEGSGFAIGLAAARFLLRFYDGRELAGTMSRALEASLGVTSREELLASVYGTSPAGSPNVTRLASLASEVLALAVGREPRAFAMIEEAARELCALAVYAGRRLRLDEPKIALAGGLLRGNTLLTKLVQSALSVAVPGCSFASTGESAAFAAARLAADAATESG